MARQSVGDRPARARGKALPDPPPELEEGVAREAWVLAARMQFEMLAEANEEAERVLREAVAMPEAGTYTRASLAYALARAGKTEEAVAIREQLREQARAGYVSPVAFATIELGLGDVDEAIRWAQAAHAERRGWLAYVRVNPLMDPMRGRPAFEALVSAMTL